MALIVVGAMAIGYAAHAVKVILTEHDHFDYLYHHGGDEALRVTSPDQRLDAVVYYQNAPAFNSGTYYLHIFPAGTKTRSFDTYSASAVLVSHRQLDVRWADPFHLQIDPGTGELLFFTNLWVPAKEGLPFVELTLVSNSGHHLLRPDGSIGD